MRSRVAKMPSVVKAISLGLLVGAVLISGCASTSGGSGGNATTAPQQPPPPSGPTVKVSLRNLTFTPQATTVHVGQRVHWVNNDNVVHNVISEDGQSFQSPNFGPGGGYTYEATVPGRFAYTCSIHPDMMATLVVVK